MRDRRGTQSGLVGESRSPQTPYDRVLEQDTAACTDHGLRIEGCDEDLTEAFTDHADVAEDNDQCKYNVENTHERDQSFGYGADSFDTAEEYACSQNGKRNTDDPVDRRDIREIRCERCDCALDGTVDGVCLRHVADAKRGQYSETAEQDRQPGPFLTETVLDIVHRTTDPIAFFVFFTIADGQRDFGVLDDHAEQCGQPEPEDGAVAAERDGL